MILTLVKIILCHILGDFVLQTNKMTHDISINRWKAKSLYLHFGIHLLLLLLFFVWDYNLLPVILWVTLSHIIIDIFTKIIFKNKLSALLLFTIDQILHISCITAITFILYNYYPTVSENAQNNLLVFLILIIVTTYVTSVTINKIMQNLQYQTEQTGLNNAGKYIGILERLFIVFFVINQIWEGVGFLLAAKSIFRFGDLKENKEVKLTEYILIGTLLSFGFAILWGILYLKTQILL
jgi:hypothetical protein